MTKRRRGSYRSPYRSRSRSYYGGTPPGVERALQHIEDARRLSEELGGTDKDVKSYFFSLPSNRLSVLLDDYQQKYGSRAREYAELTIPKWRSGAVAMSGMVAERLFNLLPPQMPVSAKYKLTENLWKHVGPRSKKRLRVGSAADLDAVLAAVRSHIDEVVVAYKVPEALERRFEWLSAGDVNVKQDLLNHLRQLEKDLVVEGARTQLPVMMAHLRSSEGDYTHRLAQTLIVGNHELELLLDRAFEGVALEDWSPPARNSSGRSTSSGGSGAIWFWLIVAALLAIAFLS